YVAGREPRLADPRQLGVMQRRLIHGEVQAVREIQRFAGFRPVFRYPERNNVVVGFVRRWYFDQFDPSFPPVTLGLDPSTGSQLVTIVQVFIAPKIPGALEQAKAARVFDAVTADGQSLGVVQRSPDPLAIAGVDRQPLRVVQL